MIFRKINTTFFVNKRNIFEEYLSEKKYCIDNANPIFITGCGRSGTHFLSEIFSLNKKVDNFHLDNIGNPIGDAYQFFSKWHNLPVNNYEFINSRGFLIEKSNNEHKRYLESNPLIAFSVDELVNSFGGNIIIVFRNPQKVIESHYRKGWYAQSAFFNTDIPGFNYNINRANHYFSRITPRNFSFHTWNSMSRIQKITWMWANTYIKIIDLISKLKDISWIHIDSFDYIKYLEVTKKNSISNPISESDFLKYVNKKPGKGKSEENVAWTDKDIEYFNSTVIPVWNRIAYVANLSLPELIIK